MLYFHENSQIILIKYTRVGIDAEVLTQVKIKLKYKYIS